MSSSGKFAQGNRTSAKLNASKVQEIRLLYGQGWSQGRLAREFEVSVVQIGRIVRRESWQHLPHIATKTELEESAQRMLAVQREVDGQASEAMQRAIAAERERRGAGQKLLEEAAAEPPVPPSPLDE